MGRGKLWPCCCAHRDLASAWAFFVLTIYRRQAVPDEVITDKHSTYARAVRCTGWTTKPIERRTYRRRTGCGRCAGCRSSAPGSSLSRASNSRRQSTAIMSRCRALRPPPARMRAFRLARKRLARRRLTSRRSLPRLGRWAGPLPNIQQLRGLVRSALPVGTRGPHSRTHPSRFTAALARLRRSDMRVAHAYSAVSFGAQSLP